MVTRKPIGAPIYARNAGPESVELRETARFAHSLPGCPREEWEPLADHAEAVAGSAAEFARSFGWEGVAEAAGWLHDAGKASAEFQAYLAGDSTARVDHSTYGARLAASRYKGDVGRLLALCIAGHHAGLPDPDDLARRLHPDHAIPDAGAWAQHITVLEAATLQPSRRLRLPADAEAAAFSMAFLVRMVFSCLVDADFLKTEAFIARGQIVRGVGTSLAVLESRLTQHMARLQARAEPIELNKLRTAILDHAVGKASESPGFFTLTVPTGGGKTLASLAFALRHALTHAKRRIIYVIPFTSIIEQTAAVFGEAIGEEAVLEHHSGFDWEQAGRGRADRDGGDERDGLGVLRRAAENWDAPVIVTTAVQFFESLFANRTSACRKLHNIADSVVVLDEAQTLPVPLLRPCLAALDELQRNYGTSVVLCTATQPALRNQDGKLRDEKGRPLGLDIPDARELAPCPKGLAKTLKRTQVAVLPDKTEDATIAERFAATPQMLCIVNSRAHARALYDRVSGLPGAAHLTTLMCPAHRRERLAALRVRLKAREPVRLVATSLIEAGVDISFPEVWRALAGLDSIAQAAGRCNREGELLPELGRVVVFDSTDFPAPRALLLPQQAARAVLRDHAQDPLSPAALAAFFGQLYFQRGMDALDDAKVGDRLQRGILKAMQATALDLRFPFASIAQAFRLIDETMQPVVVPFNEDAEQTLATVAAAERAPRDALRKLQQYTVGIPRRACDAWLRAGEITPVRRDLGIALLRFGGLAHYRDATGVDLLDPAWRAAEANVW